jgi:helix-turn-helix protein
VYEDYVHNIARNQVILEQRNEDVTNKQFIDKVIKNMQEFTGHITETVILPKKTDEEIIKENIEAVAEQEMNETMEGAE